MIEKFLKILEQEGEYTALLKNSVKNIQLFTTQYYDGKVACIKIG